METVLEITLTLLASFGAGYFLGRRPWIATIAVIFFVFMLAREYYIKNIDFMNSFNSIDDILLLAATMLLGLYGHSQGKEHRDFFKG